MQTQINMKQTITFEIDPEILEQVNRISSTTGIPKVTLFLRALVQYYNLKCTNEKFLTPHSFVIQSRMNQEVNERTEKKKPIKK